MRKYSGYSHYRSNHLGLKKHKCSKCSRGFDVLRDLKRHLKNNCKHRWWTPEETERLKDAIVEMGTGAPCPPSSRSDKAVARKISKLTEVKACVSCREYYLVDERHECLKRCPSCTETYPTYKELREHRRSHLEDLKKRGILSKEHIEKIEKLRTDGWSYAKIGEEVGKDGTTIYSALKRRQPSRKCLKPEECQRLIDLVEEEPRKPWKEVKRSMDEILDRPRSLNTFQVMYGHYRVDPRFR